MSMPVLKRFYHDRFMQLKSFALNTLVVGTLAWLLLQLRDNTFFHYEFALWHVALLIPAFYWGGLSAVWMHNATHGSFKSPLINRLAGEIAGIHQLWGFTGWKLIHLVHHMYSDNLDHDTHPPKNYSFWQFAKIMFIYSSRKISERYRAHWGVSTTTNLIQLAGLLALALQVVANLAFLFLLLGPALFLWFFIPSLIVNHLVYVDINYSAHPVGPDGNTAPANLNETLYHRLANILWHGIYFHGNHHRWPLLFNPRHVPERKARTRTPSPA